MQNPYTIEKVPSPFNTQHPEDPPRYSYEVRGPGLSEPRRYGGLTEAAVQDAVKLFMSIYQAGYSNGFTQGFGPRLITISPEKGYLVWVKPLEEGRLVATCPSFEACTAEGTNEAEVLQNAREAILIALASGAKELP
jgi:predicted RNase H-like HicB family nuclease